MFITHRASTPVGWTTLKHHTAVWSKWRPLYGGKGVKNATRSGTKLKAHKFGHHPQLKHYRAAIRDRGDKFLCVNAVESQWVTNMARKGEHAQLWSRLISPGWSIQDLPKFTQVYAAGILRVCHLRSTYICRRHLCTTLKSTPALSNVQTLKSTLVLKKPSKRSAISEHAIIGPQNPHPQKAFKKKRDSEHAINGYKKL